MDLNDSTFFFFFFFLFFFFFVQKLFQKIFVLFCLFVLKFPDMFSDMEFVTEVKFLTYQLEAHLLVLFRIQIPPLHEESRHSNTK